MCDRYSVHPPLSCFLAKTLSYLCIIFFSYILQKWLHYIQEYSKTDELPLPELKEDLAKRNNLFLKRYTLNTRVKGEGGGGGGR